MRTNTPAQLLLRLTGTLLVFLWGLLPVAYGTTVDLAATPAHVTILGPQAGAAIGAPGRITFEFDPGSGTKTFSFTNGRTLAVGDINGDGLEDIVIGSPSLGDDNRGAVFVVLGKPWWTNGHQVDLATEADLVLIGGAADEQVGHTVAIGDINGDGVGDLLVGAPGAQKKTGRVYIIYGNHSLATGTQKVLSPGLADFTIHGRAENDAFGFALAAGDLNQDGVDDIIIGAPRATAGRGMVFVQFGRHNFDAFGSLDLGKKDADVEISGRHTATPTMLHGIAVAAGDITGNGEKDLVFTAPRSPDLLTGQSLRGAIHAIRGTTSFFIAGRKLALQDFRTSYEFYGASYQDYLGASLALGDVNGSGRADLLLGAPKMIDGKGALQVAYMPAPGATIYQRSFTAYDSPAGTPPDLSVVSRFAGGELGFSCAAGDWNGDGLDDILIGMPVGSPASRAHAGQVDLIVPGESFNPTLAAKQLLDTSLATPVLRYVGKTGSQLGASVAMGDVTGNGRADLIIAAPGASPKNRVNAGEVYVLFAPRPLAADAGAWMLYH